MKWQDWTRGPVLVGVIAIALLHSGCGGGRQAGEITVKPIPTVHSSSLTKAEFLKRADAICFEARRRAQMEFMRYLRRTGLAISRGAITKHAAEIYSAFNAPYYERQIEGIRALGAPKGDARRVTAILNAIKQGIAAGKSDPAGYLTGGQDPFGRAYGLATAYGLTRCATS
jgi:hypothetical protein